MGIFDALWGEHHKDFACKVVRCLKSLVVKCDFCKRVFFLQLENVLGIGHSLTIACHGVEVTIVSGTVYPCCDAVGLEPKETGRARTGPSTGTAFGFCWKGWKVYRFPSTKAATPTYPGAVGCKVFQLLGQDSFEKALRAFRSISHRMSDQMALWPSLYFLPTPSSKLLTKKKCNNMYKIE